MMSESEKHVFHFPGFGGGCISALCLSPGDRNFVLPKQPGKSKVMRFIDACKARYVSPSHFSPVFGRSYGYQLVN